MQKNLIPLSVIRDLKCCHCQDFINCGPIHVVPDKGVLCGRCKLIAKPTFRNYAFEAIANIYLYPCKYWEDHCNHHLQWNESLEHEENCSYSGCCTVCCAHPGAFCSSKRKLPSNENSKATPLPDNLLDQIKCFYCECYLSCDPIFILENGQNVCHRCVNSNGPPKNATRNLVYEKLASTLIFPCIYRNRSCPTKLIFGRTLWKHEANCSYGIIQQTNSNDRVRTKKLNEKERGVIQTQWGHYYGTIVDRAFAPPINGNKNITNDLIKSLKTRHEKKERKRIDDVDGFKMNSEGSSDTSSALNYDQLSDDYYNQKPYYPVNVQPKSSFHENDHYHPPNQNRGSKSNSFRDEIYLPSKSSSFREDYQPNHIHSEAKINYYRPQNGISQRNSFREDYLQQKPSFRDNYNPAPVHSRYSEENGPYSSNVSRQSSINSGYLANPILMNELRANKLYKTNSITERDEPINNFNPYYRE